MGTVSDSVMLVLLNWDVSVILICLVMCIFIHILHLFCLRIFCLV